MKAFFDPSEEIAWGPLTLQEIKDDLAKEPARIERRHSDPHKYSLNKKPRRGSSLLLELNDTVKEMEMALEHGLDYVMPDNEDKENKNGRFKVPEVPKSKVGKNKYEHVISPVALYIRSGERQLSKSAQCLLFKNK